MKAALFLVLASVGIGPVHAAPFQNLGFDEAITNHVTPLSSGGANGPIQELLPGWLVLVNDAPINEAYINSFALYSTASLFDANGPATQSGWKLPVEGKYALLLENSGDVFHPLPAEEVRLLQVGEVPFDSAWLHFTAINWHVQLKLNGQDEPILYTPRAGEPGVFDGWVYDSTVLGEAGAPLEMEFIAYTGLDRPIFFGIDSIEFVVPEPGTLPLAAAAALLTSVCWWVKIRRSSHVSHVSPVARTSSSILTEPDDYEVHLSR